ncbi:MAG: hypothetical protein KatS3mg102_0736 [Planctomycetota bacterium]|nr:MAG: hypothetical protein KatS3mg102_0736 [Planctomycetota bacterium]
MAFLVVYIREAHPADGPRPDRAVRVPAPRTLEQRCELVGRCLQDLGLELPCVIDGMDNAVERAYDAWPDRLFLIGTGGRVLWRSGHGPRGFRPQELERELDRLFATPPAPAGPPAGEAGAPPAPPPAPAAPAPR